MIKVKIKTIINAKESFEMLMGKEFPGDVGLHLARLFKACENELATYDEQRLKLCEKYGKLDEKQNRYLFTEHAEEFQKQYEKLVGADIELGFDKIILPQIAIEPKYLVWLDDFITFEGVTDD